MDEALLPLLRTTLGSEALAAGHAPMVVDMGICWTVARLASAAACLALSPNAAALDELMRRTASNGVAVYGPHAAGGAADYEVRTFFVENGVPIEDPVTGSANACIARLLPPDAPYSVRQGTALQRDGRVAVSYADGEPSPLAAPWKFVEIRRVYEQKIATE